MIASSNTVFVTKASAPNSPPSASEPVSPMKIRAGLVFHHRKPRQAPIAAAAGVDLVVAVGPDAVGIASGAEAGGLSAGEGSVHVPDRAAARSLLAGVLAPGDVVLVKASRAHGLEVLAADLLAEGTA